MEKILEIDLDKNQIDYLFVDYSEDFKGNSNIEWNSINDPINATKIELLVADNTDNNRGFGTRIKVTLSIDFIITFIFCPIENLSSGDFILEIEISSIFFTIVSGFIKL